MHVDGRTLESGTLIEGDVCIIGAGSAGISMALDWINTTHKVILLEGGGFDVEPEVQDLYRGKSIGQPYFPLQSSRLHYFGGTTGIWAGFCSVFDPIDFRKREWVPDSGWPLEREELDPYYEKAHQILELGPFNYDLNFWKDRYPDLPTLDLDARIILNKMWQFSPPTRFGKKYKDTLLRAGNIQLITYANLTQIELNESGSQVKQLIVRNLQGKQHLVRAKYFVLACCSIQNARLLLASNQTAKKGVGNDNDLVGRFFMEHIEINSAELYLAKAINPKFYQWELFNTKVRAELALSEEKQEELQTLNGTLSLWPHTGRKPDAHIHTYSDRAEDLVRYADYMEERHLGKSHINGEACMCNRFTLFTRMEQAPNPASRVMLDTELDQLGVPRVILNWELTNLERRSVRTLHQLLGQQAGSYGIGRVKLYEWLQPETDKGWPSTLGGGWHHMGTTRMHENPKKGVVDATCKVHGMGNLYIAGASAFPTGGAANPTLTLIALSLRLSDHLKQFFRQPQYGKYLSQS